LKVNDEKRRIRIHTKMSWIRNTGFCQCWCSCILLLSRFLLLLVVPAFAVNPAAADIPAVVGVPAFAVDR
jgi:hypothetical protein